MNAIELLTKDHEEAMMLIERLESADDQAGTDPTQTETFNKLKSALTLHTSAEEQIFYPALEKFEETRDLVQEAYREHQEVDRLLNEISALAPNQEEFQDKLSELKDSIEHHVDEEENDLFPQAEDLCGQSELEEMGRQIQEMKKGRTATATMKRK
jgi:iron-sulfur cluster repair protein YtfE (RIC family)